MSEIVTSQIESFDGTRLAVHRIDAAGGEGRPVLLLHGLFSSAQMNWIKFGHAQALADAGFQVFMPDHRGHGESDAPHDPAHWPADVLVRDCRYMVQALGLAELIFGQDTGGKYEMALRKIGIDLGMLSSEAGHA